MNLASEIRKLANAATCAALKMKDHEEAFNHFAVYALHNATAIADALEENERLKARPLTTNDADILARDVLTNVRTINDQGAEIVERGLRIRTLEAQLAAKDAECEKFKGVLESSNAACRRRDEKISSLQRELAEAREWISVYGSHTATCEATKSLTNPRPCDCGLDTFRAKEKA